MYLLWQRFGGSLHDCMNALAVTCWHACKHESHHAFARFMLMAGGVWACMHLMAHGNTLAHGHLMAPDSCQAIIGSGSHNLPLLLPSWVCPCCVVCVHALLSCVLHVVHA